MTRTCHYLGLTFAGYLRQLLRTRGFWYWQRGLFTDYSRIGDRVTIKERTARRMIGELFGDQINIDLTRRGPY